MKLIALSIKDPGTGEFTNINLDGRIPTGGIGGETGLQKIVSNGIVGLLIIAALLSLIYLIWGGIGWITSGGDKTKVQAARNKMVYAIIGLIISFLAFMIVGIVAALFGVSIR